MDIQRFDSNGRYHNAVRFQNLLFLSGQTATEAGDDIEAQSKAMLEKAEKALENYGTGKDNILRADVYIRNPGDVGRFNEIWDKWVSKGNEPARACIVTELGRPQILAEIVIIAAVKE